MKKIFLICLLTMVSAPAFASFGLNLDGRNFTCTEGGDGSSNACVCKKSPDGYIYAYLGEFTIAGAWSASGDGMISCRQWIKNNPDKCQ
ncbi:MAG: hypothetical protein M9962_07255 [Oligoflexia bacterium]|nr:hypothetical protein [Oligoflexia bacterium]